MAANEKLLYPQGLPVQSHLIKAAFSHIAMTLQKGKYHQHNGAPNIV